MVLSSTGSGGLVLRRVTISRRRRNAGNLRSDDSTVGAGAEIEQRKFGGWPETQTREQPVQISLSRLESSTPSPHISKRCVAKHNFSAVRDLHESLELAAMISFTTFRVVDDRQFTERSYGL